MYGQSLTLTNIRIIILHTGPTKAICCVCVLLTAVEKATGVRQTSGRVGTTCSSYDTLSRELGSISQGSVTAPASGNNCTPERANRALSVARTL